MKVGVNGLFLTRPYSGMGQYVSGLLQALPAADDDLELIVFIPEAVEAELPTGVRVEVVPTRRRLGRGLALDHWERVVAPRAALDAGADVYHAPYPTPANDIPIPTVMTVHDMIPWQLPYYRRALRSRIKYRKILDGIRRADRILTVSEAAAEDIAAEAGVGQRRIRVTYEGVGPAFAKKPAAASVTKAKREHKLDRPYVFYLGGFDYRKNVRGLIAAFGESGLADTHDLVIGGTAAERSGALYADFHRLSILLAQAGIKTRTRLLGPLTESDKARLLAGAACFVYPSLAEGFGLPILEALAVGTPVAASRLPVTRELFGGAVQFFDPLDRGEMVTAIREAALNPSAAMRKRGRSLATRTLTWKQAAARTAAAYQGLL